MLQLCSLNDYLWIFWQIAQRPFVAARHILWSHRRVILLSLSKCGSLYLYASHNMQAIFTADHGMQAGSKKDLSAVLGLVESSGEQFDNADVEAALMQVGRQTPEL